MGIHTGLQHDQEFGIPKCRENAVHYLAVVATQLEFFISVFRGLAPTAICCRHSAPVSLGVVMRLLAALLGLTLLAKPFEIIDVQFVPHPFGGIGDC